MDVELYVYDLSKGLARQFSRQFLGIQIDAVYHTSIVFGGVEYFYGAGVQRSYPGSTHHGAPMEIIPLGKTDLPMDAIMEYLESLKKIYTPESYDLFMHNCNNFSNDFAMFLVGRGIPDHITSLPQTVLNTPFGQMLRPQLDSALRSVTQAQVPPEYTPPSQTAAPVANGNGKVRQVQTAANGVEGKVHDVTRVEEVERLLVSASDKVAVIFFTSSICAPCKICYPAYDELAANAGSQAVLMKVDINAAYDVAKKYNITATPTFIAFLKGQKEEEWSGADPNRLKGTVQLLLQRAYVPHPHANLDLSSLLRTSKRPVTYSKLPPLDKLLAKMGDAGQEPFVVAVKDFVMAVNSEGAKEAPLPDLTSFAAFLRSSTSTLPPDQLFPAIDLLRIALIDARVSGFFAEEHDAATIRHLIQHVNQLDSAPYNLRIVTLHMAANLFTSPLFRKFILQEQSFANLLTTLLSTSLLDDAHPTVRVAAASLAFNMAMANHRVRVAEGREALPESDQVELLAALLEALQVEQESKEAVKGLTLAIGLLVHLAPTDGELFDLCKAMDAAGTVRAKESLVDGDEVVQDVGRELLGRGVEGC